MILSEDERITLARVVEWPPRGAGTDALAAAVEAILAARLAAVEALADEWEVWAEGRSTPRIDAFRDAAEALRHALTATPAPGSAEGSGVREG
jgi:hypothetical protein